MHDKKRAIADKLGSQDGENTLEKNQDLHQRTRGINCTNDSSENKFAIADFVMRSRRGINTLNASGLVQQRGALTISTARCGS